MLGLPRACSGLGGGGGGNPGMRKPRMKINFAMDLINLGYVVDPMFFIYLSVNYISICSHVSLK